MCFSATASFGSCAVLLVIGAATLKNARNTGQQLLGAVPLLFCLQQFTEGVLWVALKNQQYNQYAHLAMYGFLLFAQVIWPFMVPLTVYKLEAAPARKRKLFYLLMTGGCVSVYLLLCLFLYPVYAEAMDSHIKYHLYFPFSDTPVAAFFYLIPVLIPPFMSGIKQMRYFGAVLLISFVATSVFYREFVISVWCYFAALISISVLLILLHLKKEQHSSVASHAISDRSA